ncbi:MAG: MBL fold metallo-hydrolase [Candidatus Paracaedibacteraceae bacterium]|nr:MBL fold metallo-hydrolase [Candidatus Paracaedibacteraceae bacterium]
MLNVHFLGVRGSTPCADERFVTYGGHTSCVLVEVDGTIFIFDAGSGIINASPIVAKQGACEAHLFFSHVHLDHIMGFPFFYPLWNKHFTTHIYAGSLGAYGGIYNFFANTLKEPLFPVSFTEFPGDIHCQDFEPGYTHKIGNVTVDTFMLNHPNSAVAYRLTCNGKSVCYVTDHEHGDNSNREGLIEFIRGTDLFIYDSTYEDGNYQNFKGWGHSTWQEALRLGDEADVARTAIFHHDPQNTDVKMAAIEEDVKKISSAAFVARQGMMVTID